MPRHLQVPVADLTYLESLKAGLGDLRSHLVDPEGSVEGVVEVLLQDLRLTLRVLPDDLRYLFAALGPEQVGDQEGAAGAEVLSDLVPEHARVREMVEQAVGDDQIDSLVSIKSREELIGEIITILQSPAKNLISALKSGSGKVSGIIKSLSERNPE